MNEKCKYCDYVSKCSRICEYNSIMCRLHRSFPKIADKSYEELQQENQQLKEKNELEFNDFIKFKKEQEDRHLEEKDKLIKENYHLRKQLQQKNEVIEEAIKKVKIVKEFKFDLIGRQEILDILTKYKGDNNE